MLEFMAGSRPVIAGVAGYAAALVEESEGGIVVTPEDEHGLARAIRQLQAQPLLGEKFGENGRRFVLDRFTRVEKARAYIGVLKRLTPV
jgi:glycosyltransferase involved in cell wall biosynthesis